MKFTTALAVAGMLVSCSGNRGDDSNANASVSASVEVPTTKGVHHISNQQLEVLLKQGVTLIDIRRPDEWKQTGTIAGSKRITFFNGRGQVNQDATPKFEAVAPNTKPVILMCLTGNRTRAAAQMISQHLGYQVVYNVERGITHWVAKGYPVSQ